jgi:hypothetical protein
MLSAFTECRPLLLTGNGLAPSSEAGSSVGSGICSRATRSPYTIVLTTRHLSSAETGHVHQGGKSHWIGQYFNTAAFTANAPGTFGDSGRGILEGPGINNVDFSFIKNVPFHERYRVQFRWDMFNALNRTEFSDPDTNLSDGPNSFGRITSTKGSGAGPGGSEQQYYGYTPRVMQAALKFYW